MSDQAKKELDSVPTPAASSTAMESLESVQDTTQSPNDERIVELARSFSHTAARGSSGAQHLNPFLSPTPSLDPNSTQFDPRHWARTLLHAFSEDPDQYPRQPLGVSWRYLGVHGFGRDTDYQKDMLNVLWRAPLIVKEALSHRKRKIQILNEFDGLVKSREMLLVLGRPGR